MEPAIPGGRGWGGGGTPYKGVTREGSALKGYLFQASGI